MNVLTLLEMAATGMPGRVGIGRLQPADAAPVGLTYRALLDRAQCGAGVLVERGAEELVYVGVNADDFAVALFAAAWAGIPLVPLNYRLSRDALAGLLSRHPNALVISDLQLPTTAHAVTVAQWRAAWAERSGNPSPWSDDPEASRHYFQRLRELAGQHDLAQLSMGMSHDLETAIEEGSTCVRVGTALFGKRKKP